MYRSYEELYPELRKTYQLISNFGIPNSYCIENSYTNSNKKLTYCIYDTDETENYIPEKDNNDYNKGIENIYENL